MCNERCARINDYGYFRIFLPVTRETLKILTIATIQNPLPKIFSRENLAAYVRYPKKLITEIAGKTEIRFTPNLKLRERPSSYAYIILFYRS